MQRYVSKELFHFVGRTQISKDDQYNLLKKIIVDGVLLANTEINNQINNKKAVTEVIINTRNKKYQDRIKSSCVCFCDIPIQDLNIHMNKYSTFGISFKKDFLIKRGAKPIFYFPIDAFRNDRGRILVSPSVIDSYNIFDLISLGNEISDKLENDETLYEIDIRDSRGEVIGKQKDTFNGWYNELCLSVFSLLKPFKSLESDDSEENYYMEREWRSPINIKFSITDIYRIIIPDIYSKRFRDDFKEYYGQITYI